MRIAASVSYRLLCGLVDPRDPRLRVAHVAPERAGGAEVEVDLPSTIAAPEQRETLVARRFTTADEVAQWAREVHQTRNGPSGPGRPGRHEAPPSAASSRSARSTYPEIAANAALALIAVAVYLLERQLETLARNFEEQGGFSERLYRVRQARRRGR